MLKRPEIITLRGQSAFTLVEVVIGIVVLAIALVLITTALGPLYTKSTEPWHQVRAAELGHSFLNEVMARSFAVMRQQKLALQCFALTPPLLGLMAQKFVLALTMSMIFITLLPVVIKSPIS
jgi:MSHA pilin protein MshD